MNNSTFKDIKVEVIINFPKKQSRKEFFFESFQDVHRFYKKYNIFSGTYLQFLQSETYKFKMKTGEIAHYEITVNIPFTKWVKQSNLHLRSITPDNTILPIGYQNKLTQKENLWDF